MGKELLLKNGNIKMKTSNPYEWIIGFIVLLIIFFSCRFTSNIENKKITSIQAIYLNAITHTPERLDGVDLLDFHDISSSHRVIITNDTVFFDTLLSLINSLEIDTSGYSVDARIYCEMFFSNGDTFSLVLGSNFGTELNGKRMKDNDILTFLIKKKIGFYRYCPFELLYIFKELKDTIKLKEIQNKWRKYRI
jgi:hypothetical protein